MRVLVRIASVMIKVVMIIVLVSVLMVVVMVVLIVKAIVVEIINSRYQWEVSTSTPYSLAGGVHKWEGANKRTGEVLGCSGRSLCARASGTYAPTHPYTRSQ